MTALNAGQDAWVRTPGTSRWSLVEVVDLPGPHKFDHEGFTVQYPNGERATVHPSHIVATLEDVKRYHADAPDFTEDDEPMGEVPDLPPFSPSQRLAEAVKLANAAAAASLHAVGSVSEHRMGEAIHELPPPVPATATVDSTLPVSARWTGERIDAMIARGVPKKQFAPGGYDGATIGSLDAHPSSPRGFIATDRILDGARITMRHIDESTLTQQRTEQVKQNPDAPTVMGVEGDQHRHTAISGIDLGKVAYPQTQRRDALAQAYGILHEDDKIVDVTDAIRLAEYIVSGIDYADTPRSIQAEAHRTETDAATDLAVSKLLDAPRTEDGKRWD